MNLFSLITRAISVTVFIRVEHCTRSFFLLEGIVGTNFNFCVPCLVTSDDFLAKLPIAFVGEDEREEAAPWPEDIDLHNDTEVLISCQRP